MYFMYGRGNGNDRQGQRLYVGAYLNNQIPSVRALVRLHQRLRDTCSFGKQSVDSERPRSVSTPEAQGEILALLEETNLRRISVEVEISAPHV